MADDLVRDELALLRTVVAAQQLRLARLERRPRRRRLSPRLVPLALVALLLALVPLSLLAADPFFSDLNAAAPVHRPNIQAIGNVGITTGFADPNDATARLYDPKGPVTREEMASFLARTAGLGTNPPVVNAKTAQTAVQATTATTATTATSAATAGNATTVGGLAPNQLLRVARTLVPNNIFASPAPQSATQVTAAFPTFQPIGTVTLTAPADGFVLVMASSFAATRNSQLLRLQLRDPLNGEISPFSAAFSGSPGALEGSVTPIHLFKVAAGERSFILEAGRSAGGVPTDTQLANTTITALYVPFGSTGGSAFEINPLAPSGASAPSDSPPPGPLLPLGR